MIKDTLKKQGLIAIAACAAIAAPSLAQANTAASQAEELRSLNIMLMVTSLRCRNTEHDFRDEYYQFNAAHKTRINGARQSMQRQMAARYGNRGSKRALDRHDVQIANAYGTGHPWLSCAELKQTTRELSAERDQLRLSAAARELLSERPRQVALVSNASSK